MSRRTREQYRCPTTGRVFEAAEVRHVDGHLWAACPLCAPGCLDWHADPLAVLYCTACNTRLTADEFYRDRSRPSGRSARCKPCHAAHTVGLMRAYRTRRQVQP